MKVQVVFRTDRYLETDIFFCYEYYLLNVVCPFLLTSVLSIWEWPPSSYFVRLQYTVVTVCVNAFNAAVKYFVKAQSSLINFNHWRQGMIRFLFHLYIWSNHDGEHNLIPLHFLFSHNSHLVRWVRLKECDWAEITPPVFMPEWPRINSFQASIFNTPLNWDAEMTLIFIKQCLL